MQHLIRNLQKLARSGIESKTIVANAAAIFNREEMTMTKEDELQRIERRYRELGKEIKRLMRQRETEQVPWEPVGGNWTVGSKISNDESMINIGRESSSPVWRKAGSEYPTQEAAESVAKRDYFFRRLCALACELNPSGKLGNQYGVYWDLKDRKWEVSSSSSCSCPFVYLDAVFETQEAAEQAVKIMNRDEWEADW